MAGLTGHQTVVDVVAASEKLRPSAVTYSETAVSLEPALAAPTEVGAACALGHPSAPGARFCGRCGLEITGQAPPPAAPRDPRPKPVSKLTPEELAERERQHAAALAAAREFERADPVLVPPEGETVLIHFIADGLTAFGQVWFRGQELEIGPGHPRWAEARRWITMTRMQQVEKWGEQKFDSGPWPGRKSYADAEGSFEQLVVTDPQGNPVQFAGPTQAQLLAADEAERRRARAVPALNFG
jgi:hypothetical protein